MGKILDGLKKYYAETPEEILVHNAKKIDYLNEIGPDALEFVKQTRTYVSEVLRYPEIYVLESSEDTAISPSQRYYLAA